MKVYVMRHGQTCWNACDRIQGDSKTRLSELGKKQAQTSAENFKNTKIDVIFASPTMRTMQTANFVNKFHNVKIIKDDRIKEIDQGDFKTRFYKDLTKEEEYSVEVSREGYNQETWDEVNKKTIDFVKFLKQTNYGSILIVTHGFNAICLENLFLNKKVDYKNYAYRENFKNAEIRGYEI